MTTIIRNALLPYSCKQMYELVDNIDDYPRFLPWCQEAETVYRDDKMVEARLNLTWSGLHKHFTTRNHLTPLERIEITLVQGPFKHLEGLWVFTPLGEDGCKVELKLEFEFAGSLLDMMFQSVFQKIANSLVELFTKRAIEVYGDRKED